MTRLIRKDAQAPGLKIVLFIRAIRAIRGYSNEAAFSQRRTSPEASTDG
jgi:hypothetical protein